MSALIDSEEEKVQFSPLLLEEFALKFYEIIRSEDQYRCFDPLMTQKDIIHNLMKVFKSITVRYLKKLKNNSIKDLKCNIRNNLKEEFMATNQTNDSQKSIFKGKNYQNNQIMKTLHDNFTKIIKDLEKKTITEFTNKITKQFNGILNDFSKLIQNSEYGCAPKFKNNNSQCESIYNNCKPFSHSKESYYFHIDQLTCQLCDTIGHTADKCSKYLGQEKKRRNRSRRRKNNNRFPFWLKKNKNNNTIKHRINISTESLHIEAYLKNIKILLTIDTNLDICCIKHTLIPHGQIIKNVPILLTGPNNEHLIVLGSTLVHVMINSQTFEILTYVVKNLSCAMIIGNDILNKHNAQINFKNETLTLSKSITTRTYNNHENHYINQIKEEPIDLFATDSSYSIAHCISADLKMSRGIAATIKKIFGDATPILSSLNPKIGDVIPIRLTNRIVYFLITKNKCFHTSRLSNIKISIKKLKETMLKQHDLKIAIPTTAIGQDNYDWTIIKQMIYAEFYDTNINLLICYNNIKKTTTTRKTKELNEVLNRTLNFKLKQTVLEKNINELNIEDKFALAIYREFVPGENVPGDGNCGIYALCNALNDGKCYEVTTIPKILDLLNLSCLPNYYWSDDELASLADHYGHNTYVYNDYNNTGHVYQNNDNKKRPSIVLYNVNNNTHWIPGKKSIEESSKIPIKIITTNNIVPLQNIIKKVQESVEINYNTTPSSLYL
jgi:hypothetical protein